MSIIRSAFTVSSWNMVSRATGFIRELVIAAKIGASGTSDAFFVALTLPNLLRRIFAEGAFNVAFVPILSALLEEKGQKEAERFAAVALSLLSLTLLGITVVACLFMPQVILLVASGLPENPESYTMAILLGRITFPYIMLITIASLFGSVANTLGRFWPYAFTPILLNLSFITLAFALTPFGIIPEVALAIAMPVGGVLQVAFMFYAVRKAGFVVRLTEGFKHEKTKPLLLRMGPAALSLGILQISFIIDTQLASFLQEKSISYLQYASRFYQFPLSMIGVTMATVLLPHMSRALRRQQKGGADEAFTHAVVYGLALGLASAIGLFMLAHPLFSTVYERGAFTAADSAAAAAAMMAYCVGLPAFIITKITSTAFYANHNTKTPLYVSVASLAVNATGNIILMQYFDYLGIAVATAISGWFNASLQLYLLQREGVVKFHNPQWLKQKLGNIAVISAMMAAVLVAYDQAIPMPQNNILAMVWVGCAAALGAATFLGLGHFAKLFDIRHILGKILNKIH